MLSAIKAETLRLVSLRSTLVYAILLTGAFYGPPVLLVMFSSGDSTINAADFGQCVMIVSLVAIAFAGASTAGEIRRGSTGISFLTQQFRSPSFIARLIVVSGFLTLMYALGFALALGVTSLSPAGFDLGNGGWAYMGVQLLQVLFWALVATCIAVLTRSTVAAVSIPMAWYLLIESLLPLVPIEAFQTIAQWTPANNWSRILTEVYENPFMGSIVTHGVGAAVVAVTATAGVFAAAAWFSHTRRDIPA